jgi:hypothetical protein
METPGDDDPDTAYQYSGGADLQNRYRANAGTGFPQSITGFAEIEGSDFGRAQSRSRIGLPRCGMTPLCHRLVTLFALIRGVAVTFRQPLADNLKP